MRSRDPVACQAKLVAEPWDVGQMDSYDLGQFPALWREWNGKYRDTMRDFWRSDPVGIGEFADRFTGPDKHNEANGEDNRDGTSDNNSWNCGAEGRPATRSPGSTGPAPTPACGTSPGSSSPCARHTRCSARRSLSGAEASELRWYTPAGNADGRRLGNPSTSRCSHPAWRRMARRDRRLQPCCS